MSEKIPIMNMVEKEIKSHNHKINLCSNCECIGDLERCMKTECSLHEAWIVRELKCYVNFAKENFGCNRKECRVSKGICGSVTFGTGKLDFNGYWEFPCKKCEEAYREYIKQGNIRK